MSCCNSTECFRSHVPATIFLTASLLMAFPGANASNSVFTTRVFAGDCVIAEPSDDNSGTRGLGDVAESLISKGISTSLNLFTGAVRKAGEASTASFTATANIEVSSGAVPQCVQLVRGKFFGREADFTASTNSITRERPDAHEKLNNIGAYLAEEPLLFFEGQVRRSSDKSAIAIGPSFLLYNEAIGSSVGTDVRDLVFSFVFAAPGASPDEGSGTVGQLQFNELAYGTKIVYDSLSPGKVSMPETPWIPLATSESTVPITLSITVSETRDANEFLLFIADTLSGAQEQLDTALKQTLLASERAKLRGLEAEAQRQQRENQARLGVAAIEAETEARMALHTYDNLADGTDEAEELRAAGEARKKQLVANLAATTAGLPPPFSEEDLVVP